MDDFLWRVSVAEVGEPGAFSIFPEVDRVLAVLEGRLSLRVAGDREPTILAPNSFARAFPGDVAAQGEPIDGPVRDLNVMVRRGAWRAQIDKLLPSGSMAVEILTPCTLIVAMGNATLRHGHEVVALGRLDAILTRGCDRDKIELASEGPVYLIHLSAEDDAAGSL